VRQQQPAQLTIVCSSMDNNRVINLNNLDESTKRVIRDKISNKSISINDLLDKYLLLWTILSIITMLQTRLL